MATTTVPTHTGMIDPATGVADKCTCGSTVSHDSIGVRIVTRCDATQRPVHSRLDI